MCGIVGYLGPRQPKDVLVSGLRALEYRGYDSSGVAILDQGKLKRVRAQGKLIHLVEKLKNENFDGHLGIGHTRWATHGKPSERNAHPHCVGGISIVHNGIIENYAELKLNLLKGGAVFESETDSELVAHLIHNEVKSTQDLLQAVLKILPLLKGAFSIVTVWEEQPETLVAFKNGPPLIVGFGTDEFVVASDLQAILPYTNKIVYLDDFQVAYIHQSQFQLLDQKGHTLEFQTASIDWNSEQAQKGGFDHYMLKEIFEQPRAVANAILPHLDTEKFCLNLNSLKQSWTGAFKDIDLTQVERVLVVACGTSYYAGMLAKYWIESKVRIPVEVDIASEFRYRNPVLFLKTLTLVISQSGETADTLAALRLVKESGGPILSICNVPNSSIDREAHCRWYMNAGVEIGVASTKAFTATMALLYVFSLALAKIKMKLSSEQEQEAVKAILGMPSHMETVLAFDSFFAEVAHILTAVRGFLYMGRGIHYPIALEGALKLKELAYRHAEGYAAGEMKHGPLALIDSDMLVIMLAASDELYEKTISNLEEAKTRGAKIVSLGTGENEHLKSLSEHYLALPKVYQDLYPLVEVIPLQLLAYHVAVTLGNDVDQPRNLAKSVTVE
ncbi:MAG: glutamine--fructose-6-phosphate transaminase (isomerizing) [Bdellovibrionales bacterium]|nr:glutamine--fructose-6-phosphate transaminase (isomerizing) [Bdellovibrionales bacterium]